VNIRLLAASNQDLGEEVKRGSFREDLFYRLNVVRIHLPELKERQRTSRFWRSISCGSSRGRTAARSPGSRERRSISCAATSGRATCGS